MNLLVGALWRVIQPVFLAQATTPPPPSTKSHLLAVFSPPQNFSYLPQATIANSVSWNRLLRYLNR